MNDDPPLGDTEFDRRTILALALGVEGGLVFLALLLGWLLNQPALLHNHWNVRDLLWGGIFTLPMVIAFVLMVHFPVGPIRGLKKLTQETLAPLFSPCTVVDLFFVSLLAGLGEEMLFRGVFQSGFSRWMNNPLGGLLVASVLFGLLHALTPTYAIMAALMGAYLGWVYMWTENLLPPILMHAVYDFFALLYLVRGPGQLPEKEAETEPLEEEETP